ncbi:MAG: DUF366 family protein [Armatimonadetes bacterium]|nr:DUF366 family protein [Armatimonadota bacterium]
MRVVHIGEPLTYDGTQLRSHWIYETTGAEGDALAWFVGPCRVASQALVDLADRRAGHEILAASMLHLLVEHFDQDLEVGIVRQRLLVAIAADVVRSSVGVAVERQGDDLFVADRKLSVSIATVSPVSVLIHLGINVDPSGAPVPAVGLAELGVAPSEAGQEIAQRYAGEIADIRAARAKVRWVW